MTASPNSVFTIGHSTHSSDAFLTLLRMHEIEAIADVRSSPFSRFNPHFSRNPMEHWLKAAGVHYVFLGRELGARSDDHSCYINGRVQYARLAAAPLFQNGIARVIRGSASYKIALMCAEKEPLECHRTLLVSQALVRQGVSVLHIHANGNLESHEAALDRLLKMTGVPEGDFFHSHDELLSRALALQEERVAFVDEGLRASSDDDNLP